MHRSLSIFALLSFSTTLSATCPSPGVWKTADQSFRLVVERQGKNLHLVVTDTTPDGSPWTLNITVPMKGGVGHVIESTGRLDGVSSKLISPFVREYVYTRGANKRARVDRMECSSDGMTIRGAESGIDIQGKPFHGAAVMSKQ
jgi:hypothetical protein